ncbi:unnamed protein product [Tetraodon nigroviridis]|uniref:(spotted green pufferfish) hypothetical protein n=1 Tax=Tetraodon nigroviridis TaxID=99883 RepID=Q4S857_TETNG|nr:unnamed protein product [Tetraodon nigroviridis]
MMQNFKLNAHLAHMAMSLMLSLCEEAKIKAGMSANTCHESTRHCATQPDLGTTPNI